MTSLVERLRVRSEKRPIYNNDDDSDDDLPIGLRMGRLKQEKQPEKFVREDAKEDACQACGESGTLICCGTCTYAFHLKCLLPPQKTAPDDSWSCPECVSPLNQMERILDFEMHPITSVNIDTAKSDSKQKHARKYLVKWKGLSYLHCTWIPEEEFKKACKANPRLKTRLNNFKSQMDLVNNSEDDWVGIRPEWTTVDRIIARRKFGNKYEYYVKWKELGYDECTWEVDSDISAFQPQIDRFYKIRSRGRNKSFGKTKVSNREPKDLKHKQKEFRHYEHTPEFLSGGTLHPYQLEGLKFLRYSWSKKTHVILADEMGLGKTIQSIAFLASLFEENVSPHLVIAPLSTLRNWEREFATWAPEMNVVMYFGTAAARAVARQYEFFHPKEEVKKHKKNKSSHGANRNKQGRVKFDVLLTSYEMINQDSSSLRAIPWECMIVDEGHRLKNKDSKLFLQLKFYSPKQRVLLTGTPLQNNLDELFMLMHFLDDGKFPSIEDFQKEFKDINQEEQVSRLHKMLAPHLLRRVKKDVMKDLPPKKELILRVDLSSKQKEYYKAILTRNYQILARRGGAQISLMNVVMELRKLCCHAFMLEGVEPVVDPADAAEGIRQLLEFSGKMQLLDKMMIKLKEQGHRVLIYSQFQHMLDLLEDYLTYKKWSYERIDGRIGGAERQIRIDRFNAKNSTRFCFLLSTRAGGLGINLATADTVIIYDSDWNPHADLQAMARAHRLGQINKVMIYRLITRGTIEERMMQLTKKKMILEHLVVGRLKAQQTVNQEELDDIIRYGSKELFTDDNDEGDNARQIHYDAAAIDRLLNRDQIRDEETSLDEEEDDFLKAFKVANFAYIDQVEAAAKEELTRKHMTEEASSSNLDRANYWDDLLKDKYEVHQVEEFTAMGKGKRSRKQMAASKEGDLAGDQDASSEDEDYSCEDELSESESLSGNASTGRRGRFSRKKARADSIEALPLMEGEGKSLRVLGFNQNQRNTFLQILMRFGFGEYDWKEFVPRLKGKGFDEVHEYGLLFMRHLDEGVNDALTFSDGVPKEGLRVDDVLIRLAHISLIKEKLKYLKENTGATLFPDDILECYPSLSGKIWKEEHDISMLEAILRHGCARWQAIVEDKENGLADVARKELGLPFLTGPFAGGIQMGDAATNSHSINGSSEATKESLSHPDCSTLYQFREVQRRIVEFIRKRYHLLEKIIDLELCLEEAEKANPCEHTGQDPDIGPPVTDASSPILLDTNSLLKDLPILVSIDLLLTDMDHCAAPDSKIPLDDHVDRLNMAKLYNGMCRISESNALGAAEACIGVSSSGARLSKSACELETIYEDVHRILTVREEGSVAAGREVHNDKVEDGIFSTGSGHASNLGLPSGFPAEVDAQEPGSLASNGKSNCPLDEAKGIEMAEDSIGR
ncbi:CHD3-type chromatin-remodeling factor PICKLE [Iris pallida]|uniref:CHD3-type chromatin-remodeling factor PICKLE n=1 Tax=Iris pallida TaxID=29817 RepID=A0AAX6IKG0_IRIPA|nr:CHD3-type chromatin-remodeling factor PICKLE [Iris pallida]